MSRAHRRRILLRRRSTMRERPGGWWATDEVWDLLRRQMAKRHRLSEEPQNPGEEPPLSFMGIPLRVNKEL